MYYLYNCCAGSSHPVGIDGQNHIIAVTPITFLPIEKVQDPELDHNGQQNVPLFYSIRRKLSIGFVQFMN